MLKSMTAYAKTDLIENGLSVHSEIRSYNSRYMDIVCRFSQGYQVFEEKIKELISKHISRGRIELKLSVQFDSLDTSKVFDIDLNLAGAYYSALMRMKKVLNIESEVNLDHLIRLNGIIKPKDQEENLAGIWPTVEKTIVQALDDLNAMRLKEGAFIFNDFSKRLDWIESKNKKIIAQSQGLVEKMRDQLKERILILTNGIVELDQARLFQEAAILADRSDISEETVRVQSHIQQFRSIMVGNEPSGRKLNFLLQELSREFNTMGAKCFSSEISHLIVEIKSEIEKLREQVQNIE